MTKPEIIVCRDVDELNRRAAAQFVALANDAIARSGRFTVALSGGSTPQALYSLLASSDYCKRVDWLRVHLFWGDERCVPPDHPESNYRMVREALLSQIQIPPENIHRMVGEIEPEQAAVSYAVELKQFFHLDENGWPRFDLIFLGLGEDGHTASLFPGSAALEETDRLVATAYVEKLHAQRLTLTLPAINAAAQASFLVSGQSKAPMIEKILGAGAARLDYPAARVAPADGRLTWLVDAAAAARLSRP